MTTSSNLCQLSSLLDLNNGEALRKLAEEARKENQTMRILTEKGTRDAAAVKVLTIMTLIYLPATVVSVSLTTRARNHRQKLTRVSRISSRPLSSIPRSLTVTPC